MICETTRCHVSTCSAMKMHRYQGGLSSIPYMMLDFFFVSTTYALFPLCPTEPLSAPTICKINTYALKYPYFRLILLWYSFFLIFCGLHTIREIFNYSINFVNEALSSILCYINRSAQMCHNLMQRGDFSGTVWSIRIKFYTLFLWKQHSQKVPESWIRISKCRPFYTKNIYSLLLR